MLSSVLRSQTANIFNPAQYANFFDFPTLGYNAFQLFVFSCEFLIFKNIHYFIVFVNYIIVIFGLVGILWGTSRGAGIG